MGDTDRPDGRLMGRLRKVNPLYQASLRGLRFLKSFGFLCFDVRNNEHAKWSLERDHPLDAIDYVHAAEVKDRAAKHRPTPSWRKSGGVGDDLACVNVGRVADSRGVWEQAWRSSGATWRVDHRD